MIKYSQFKREAQEVGLKVGIDAYAALDATVEALARMAIMEAKKERTSTVRPPHIFAAEKKLAALWKKKKG